MRSGGIRTRLFWILGLAALAMIGAGAVALLALSEIRAEAARVMGREVPAAHAALRLARIAERLQGRAPALVAAAGADARRYQAGLVREDLQALSRERAALVAPRPNAGGPAEAVIRLAPDLALRLRELAEVLEQQAADAQALARQRTALLAVQDRARQALGPSILAVAEVVRHGPAHGGRVFPAAVAAQGPLLEAERAVDAAVTALLIAADAPDPDTLVEARRGFARLREQLAGVLAQVPAGLRAALARTAADLTGQLGSDGMFDLRARALEARRRSDALVAGARLAAAGLKGQVDALVLGANASIVQAAERMGRTIAHYTLVFAVVSLAIILLATLLAYRLVVRDISRNLRAVTGAMQRLAAGERDARVPAVERRDEIGDLARVFSVFKDNALRMESLGRQLAEKSRLLVATFDNMNDGFTVFDAEARLVAWNPQFLRLYGLADAEVGLETPLTDIHRILAERGARARDPLAGELPLGALAEARGAGNRQFELHCADGRVMELRSNPMPGGGFVTIHLDVTERRAIEAQLRQAQKMELVGQLTGGIAHDFNNILAAIVGNLAILEQGLREYPELHERSRKALAAADRASGQIQRLLAFARRQQLHPEVVDLNALVSGMTELLEYSLGGDVELSTELAAELPAVRIDPGQLENALMNLAVNARDAMNGAGRLSFVTRSRDDGTVELAVTDTGGGIPPELAERVFEPFFTTKAPGKGSGLGLSMVYGFVRQSGGGIALDSAPGRGTTVTLSLPVAVVALPASEAAPPRGNGEWVLVVDDDHDLLEVTAEQLRGLGYCVLAAGGGAEALALLEREPAVALLYTDLVMPAPWDGVALAREARARRRGLPVLFTSAEPGDLEVPAAGLLRKPVALETLALAVRAALDGQAAASSEA